MLDALHSLVQRLRSSRSQFVIVLVLLGLGGCIEHAHYGGPPIIRPVPDLAVVLPGVRVIVDYEEAVFRFADFYWWYCGHDWYRSKSYTGGWEIVRPAPSSIARIANPDRYRHFRPYDYVARRRPARFQNFVLAGGRHSNAR
jgi:hypothetical protein